MHTIRIFHLIDDEMKCFGGPEAYFCKHLESKFQRIINIRLNTKSMTTVQKNSLREGNLPQPWFPRKIMEGSKLYFHYYGDLVAFGTVEETIINYPYGNPRNTRNLSEEDYSLYPFSFKIKSGSLSCWNHEDLTWDRWIPIINDDGRFPNQRAYIKVSPEEDEKIMKLIPEKKVCQW